MASRLDTREDVHRSVVSDKFRDFYGRLADLLEGPKAHRDVGAGLDQLRFHVLVTRGVQKDLARLFSSGFLTVPRKEVLRVIGVSERALLSADESALLSPGASDRLLRLASVAQQAMDVLGSQEAAEAWLAKPAIGLDRNRPIDLITTSAGTGAVKALLKRMDYEVYV
ncbi:antitoxin Xre/MbcA/ParS toxin-binding domain-containing protein [Viridibacterium curvum]|uniref:Antitoxin Xre/MbcA/ParS-like toxin-binding domain-containing protein n=1 Tax=Viridibacterium curvum TaxID=1101404 RepID=A0ABP9R759_9RHOO